MDSARPGGGPQSPSEELQSDRSEGASESCALSNGLSWCQSGSPCVARASCNFFHRTRLRSSSASTTNVFRLRWRRITTVHPTPQSVTHTAARPSFTKVTTENCIPVNDETRASGASFAAPKATPCTTPRCQTCFHRSKGHNIVHRAAKRTQGARCVSGLPAAASSGGSAPGSRQRCLIFACYPQAPRSLSQ